MIALILATRNEKDPDESDDDDNDAETTRKKKYYKGGTLVVCPAFLMSQWETEARNKSNELSVWKRWFDKEIVGHQRLTIIIKLCMLRRTKKELMAKDKIENLPDKFIKEVKVKLDRHEQLVHDKILAYSRTLFKQFLSNQKKLDSYDGPAFPPNEETHQRRVMKRPNELPSDPDIKIHEFFVLILRLWQVCCHPALIHTMLDEEDLEQNDMTNVDIGRLRNVSLNTIADVEEEESNRGITKRK